jgi:hypothetical protein
MQRLEAVIEGDVEMKLAYGLSGLAGAIALGMLSLSAQAAPLAGAPEGPKANVGENNQVQDVRWGRRCWRHGGHVHCRGGYRRWGHYPHYRRHYYGGPAFYGPGFGFYFGPRPYYW